jgi:thiamine-monophosphate kinase
VTSPRHLSLAAGNEFDLLRSIFARLGPAAGVLGDDCALIDVGGTTVALSIDASLEGVHFRTDWLSFEEIGWRATAAALSDLAAVGATATGVLITLGLPDRDRAVGNAVEIMAGVGSAVAAAGAKVLGGDLTRSDHYLVDVAVVGTVERAVTRGGARPGDELWVTGVLGAPGAALRALEAGQRLAPGLRHRFAKPEPRLVAGRRLGALGATAMIDISDGLAADARQLAAASALTLEIALERIPCWPGVSAIDALASGEEYELLVALPPTFSGSDASRFTAEAGVAIARIGRCATGSPELRVTERGRPVAAPAGWDHLTR